MEHHNILTFLMHMALTDSNIFKLPARQYCNKLVPKFYEIFVVIECLFISYLHFIE